MANNTLLQVCHRNDDNKWYEVTMSNGKSRKYPYVWLKDNCRCAACYNTSCLQRETLIVNLDVDIVPASESVAKDGKSFEVVWPDQHRSTFQTEWLDAQRFSESEVDPVSFPEFNVWGAEMNGNIKAFDYNAILATDEEFYGWLRTIQTTGLALVRGAPTEKGVCRKLADRVAFFRRTIYGEEFQVESRPSNVSSLGYTSKFLVLHSDLPYYEHPPDVQLLHCIEQAKGKGGENQFVDGWKIVKQLKEEYPDLYKMLSTVPVDYKNAATDRYPFHMKLARPIIDFDLRGELCMRYNDPIRASYMLMPVDRVTDMYRAIKEFNRIIYLPENVVHHRLSEGKGLFVRNTII